MEEQARWSTLAHQVNWEHDFLTLRQMVIYCLYGYSFVNEAFAREIYKFFFLDEYDRSPSHYNALVRFRELILTVMLLWRLYRPRLSGNIVDTLTNFFEEYDEAEILDDIYNRVC